ncbi:MAG: hypothetical protein AB7G88_00180 [Thermomicrobiales bacterium]
MFSRWRAERTAAQHLMRYWDASVTREESRLSRDELAAPLRETVQQVHERYDAPAADPAFSRHLLTDLMRQYHTLEAPQPPALHPPSVLGTNSRLHPRSTDWPVSRRLGQRWLLALLAATAVLLFSVAAVDYAWPESDPDPPAVVPAFVEPSTNGDLTSISLLDISFGAGEIGADDVRDLLFAEVSMAPGESLNVHYRCSPKDRIVFYVRKGSLAIHVVGDSYILRAGTTEWEPVSGGTEAEADPGDVWLYKAHADDDLTGVRNRTSDNVNVLWSPVMGDASECGSVHPGPIRLWYWTDSPGVAEPSIGLRIRTRAISAAPDVELPLEGDSGLLVLSDEQKQLGWRQWVYVESGVLEVAYVPLLPEDESDPGIIRFEAGEILIEDSLFAPLPDMQLVIKSAGDEPLELIVLDVIVGGPEATEGIPAP